MSELYSPEDEVAAVTAFKAMAKGKVTNDAAVLMSAALEYFGFARVMPVPRAFALAVVGARLAAEWNLRVLDVARVARKEDDLVLLQGKPEQVFLRGEREAWQAINACMNGDEAAAVDVVRSAYEVGGPWLVTDMGQHLVLVGAQAYAACQNEGVEL